jgi:hypothetical protein
MKLLLLASILAAPAPQPPLAVVYPTPVPQDQNQPNQPIPTPIPQQIPQQQPQIPQPNGQNIPPNVPGEELDCEETIEFDPAFWDCQEVDISQINRNEFDCWEETNFDQDFDCVEDDGDFICDEDTVPGAEQPTGTIPNQPGQQQGPPGQEPPPPATFLPGETFLPTPNPDPVETQGTLPQTSASLQTDISLLSCLLGLVLSL